MKPSRAIEKFARDGFVTVEVGPKRTKFFVHKTLITHHSEYFANALKRPWREAKTGVIVLPDVEPIVFDIFVGWIYAAKLPAGPRAWRDMQHIADEKWDPLDDNPYVTILVKAYAFGDRFLASGFQVVVLDRLIGHVSYFDAKPPWFYALAYGFNNLPEESLMLQALVDMHCRFWVDYENSELSPELEKRIPMAFWIRSTKTYAARVKDLEIGWWNEELIPCDYHRHATEEEEEACPLKVGETYYDADEE